MATITFDTLKFVETLKSHGMPDEQAKGIAEAFRDATGEAELATNAIYRKRSCGFGMKLNWSNWKCAT